MEKTRQILIGELRNTIVACNVAIKREETGKLASCFVNAILRVKVKEAEKILKELCEKENL